jgi:gluconate kinase
MNPVSVGSKRLKLQYLDAAVEVVHFRRKRREGHQNSVKAVETQVNKSSWQGAHYKLQRPYVAHLRCIHHLNLAG